MFGVKTVFSFFHQINHSWRGSPRSMLATALRRQEKGDCATKIPAPMRPTAVLTPRPGLTRISNTQHPTKSKMSMTWVLVSLPSTPRQTVAIKVDGSCFGCGAPNVFQCLSLPGAVVAAPTLRSGWFREETSRRERRRRGEILLKMMQTAENASETLFFDSPILRIVTLHASARHSF